MKYPVFTTQKEKIDFLVKNKDLISLEKKSAFKFSDPFGANIFEKNLVKDFQLKASAATDSRPADTAEVIYRTPVANTYLWMDSHEDVHIPGVFTKTLQESQGSIFHLHDHLFQVAAKVGIPQKIYEQSVPWSSLGVNLMGNTIALLADSAIYKSMNASIFDQYLKNEINQHSVGMQYVNLFLCVNDPEYKEAYASWLQYTAMGIGNMDKVMEQGYFWAITEAKLKEFSCVLNGSNELTGMMESAKEDKEEPEPSTPKEETREPVTTTQKYFHNPNLI